GQVPQSATRSGVGVVVATVYCGYSSFSFSGLFLWTPGALEPSDHVVVARVSPLLEFPFPARTRDPPTPQGCDPTIASAWPWNVSNSTAGHLLVKKGLTSTNALALSGTPRFRAFPSSSIGVRRAVFTPFSGRLARLLSFLPEPADWL